MLPALGVIGLNLPDFKNLMKWIIGWQSHEVLISQ